MKMFPAARKHSFRNIVARERATACGFSSLPTRRDETEKGRREDSPREDFHVGHIRVDLETLLGPSLCLRLQVMRQTGR